MPNLYVELRRSVLGVRVPEDIQMKGFGVKIGPNLDMGVPDVVQGAGGYRGSMAPQRPWGVEFAVGGSPWGPVGAMALMRRGAVTTGAAPPADTGPPLTTECPP